MDFSFGKLDRQAIVTLNEYERERFKKSARCQMVKLRQVIFPGRLHSIEHWIGGFGVMDNKVEKRHSWVFQNAQAAGLKPNVAIYF